jgi:hypothetical protein
MRNINSSKLTKQTILEKVSQVNIFATYLGVSVETIYNCINNGELICNPLRIDNHPTAGFRYNNKGKLKFKDFANDEFWGDCFDIVALVMSNIYNKPYNISNKEDFIKVLRHITFTFKDIFYGKEKDINVINDINTAINVIKHKKPIIELVVREWNYNDEKYWNTFGVSIKFLNLNFIYPVEQYYINRNINPEPKYFYSTNDPCYGYFLGKDSNGVNNIKLYFPKRNKDITRFITNCNHLEGIYNLDRNDYNIIVITKSTKDRVSIGSAIMKNLFLYGGLIKDRIGIINIPHETYKLRNNEYDWLQSKLTENGKIVSLMDNDRTGKIEAIWLRDTYNIIPIIIPNSYKVKDFAELVANNNFKIISDLIINTIQYIKEYEEKDKYFRSTFRGNDDLPY